MTITEEIQAFAEALARQARGYGCAPIEDAIEAEGIPSYEWVGYSMGEVPSVAKKYGASDEDGLCELDDRYLVPALQLARQIDEISEALRASAREMGCEPTYEALRAKYGEAGDDMIGDWTIDALSPVVGDEYRAALDAGDDAAYAALDCKYLDPALALASVAGPEGCDDCTDGWYVGLIERRPCPTCRGNNSNPIPVSHA
jgi:hypothetical protein